jgi:hypothetical protein
LLRRFAPRNDLDALSINNASSTSLLYLVENGRIGIATTTPTNILTIGQGMGSAIADGWDVYSSREYKTEITYLEKTDYEDILEEIEGMELARYIWKNDLRSGLSTTTLPDGNIMESQDPTLNQNLGVIVEDEGTPAEVLSKDGHSISLYDYASYALAGVKAVNSKLEILDEFLTVKQDEDGNLIEVDPLEGLRTRLAELGLVIDEDGVLIVEKVKAKAVETETLQVKAENIGKTGITLYDRSTGQPYCFYIENGVSMTAAGECAVAVSPEESSSADSPPSSFSSPSQVSSSPGDGSIQSESVVEESNSQSDDSDSSSSDDSTESGNQSEKPVAQDSSEQSGSESAPAPASAETSSDPDSSASSVQMSSE